MKKVFVIYTFVNKEIHVPSDDYYARNNQASNDTIQLFQEYETFDTEAAAEEALTTRASIKKGTYIILPTYIKG